MSYTPTEWATGDVITAEKLNNMEDGIVGGQVFEILASAGGEVIQTSEEILAAIDAGKTLFFVYSTGGPPTVGTVFRLPLVRYERKRIDGEITPTGGAEQTYLFFMGLVDNSTATSKAQIVSVYLDLVQMTYTFSEFSIPYSN